MVSIVGFEGSEADVHALDDREALQTAARAGILLLEQNHELQEEAAALRAQVAALEAERPSLQRALQVRDEELATLREARRGAVVEANELRHDAAAQRALVTELLEREGRLRAAAESAAAARDAEDARVERLEAEAAALLKRAQAAEQRAAAAELLSSSAESNQAEEAEAAAARAAAAHARLAAQVDELQQEGDALRRRAAKAGDHAARAERLERRLAKLQAANEALAEERDEERAVVESLRAMNVMYKQLADARPLAADDGDAALQPSAPGSGVVTMQDVLLETNLQLETELRALKMQMLGPAATEDGDGDEDGDEDNQREDGSLRAESSSSSPADGADGQEPLVARVQELEEKLRVAKDVIKHAKLHWSAAVASQKALEQCNRDAQRELERLAQQLAARSDYSKSDTNGSISADRGPEPEQWVEETAPFPAPPGDLTSPAIKRLLDHWTTDKAQVMRLTDWLHHAVRGTGRPGALLLSDLSGGVAAGFAQLLVPVLRERHGVSVSLYRRDALRVRADLLLQTHRPSSRATSTNAPGATAATSANGSRFLRGETQFLYG